MRKTLGILLRILTAPFRFILWLVRGIFRGISNLNKKISTFFTEEEEDTPLPDTFAKTVQNPVGLFYHLNALRKHLFRIVLGVALTSALSFTFTRQILEFLAKPLEGGLSTLRAIDPTEPVGTVMRVAFLSGFALALPYIAFEIWLFIAPGLKRRSRLGSLLAIPLATVFFLGGMAFAYYLMLPAGLPILTKFGGLITQLRPSSYIKFVTGLMFWIGAFFEMPLIVYILAGIGLVKGKMLLDQWRLAIVIMSIIAAAITPTVDPINMALVLGPMILLYFLSIGLAFIAVRGKERT